MSGLHVDADLIAYAEDALPPASRARIERHLASCAACAEALASHHDLLSALASSVPTPPPLHSEAYRRQLRGKLDERLEGRTPWRRWRVVLVPATAAVAVALLAVTVLRSDDPRGRRNGAGVDETAHHVEVIRAAPVVEHLELLEDLDVIGQLDRLAPKVEG